MKENELYKERNSQILRILLLILVISVLMMIFAFSTQNAEKSSTLSGNVVTKIVDTYPGTKNLSYDSKLSIINNYHNLIRKMAHFTEYMLLSIVATGFFSTFGIDRSRKLLIVFGVCVTYAISDEIHQLFTGGGRAFTIFDIGVDSLGVCTGLIIAFVISSIYRCITNSKD